MTSRHYLTPAEYDQAVLDMLFEEDGIVRLQNFIEVMDVWRAYEEVIIRRCRKQGYSWQDIGDVLGVTRQAVHARFADVEHENMPQEMYDFFDLLKARLRDQSNKE